MIPSTKAPGLFPPAAKLYVGIRELREKADTVAENDPKFSSEPPVGRELPPEAQRALAEAAERRRLAKLAEEKAAPKPKEINGPSGPEPTRYGDWERKGICSDF